MHDVSALDTSLILRDMADGVMCIGRDGAIRYLNERAQALLGVGPEALGATVVRLFVGNPANDGFVQLIIDAIAHKNERQRQVVDYTDGSRKLRFEMSVTYPREGDVVIVVLTDVTEREQAALQRRDSTLIISAIFVVVCLTVLAYKCIYSFFGIDLPPAAFTLVVEAICVATVLAVLPLTTLTIDDMGIKVVSVKKAVLPGVVIALGGLVALLAVKTALLAAGSGFFPAGAPFWDWGAWTGVGLMTYPFTVILQEFLTRSVMQTALKRVFDGKHSATLAVLISSLIFSVLHIGYGLPLMLASLVLLGGLGFFYEKTGNIWSLCIVHYVLGTAAYFMRFA